MIQVRISKRPSGKITAFEMTGHAEFAEHGKDLVCAAASAVSFGAVNAVLKLTAVQPQIQQGSEGGYLKVVFPETEQDEKLQTILQTMIVSLQTIEKDYGQYIKVTDV